MRSIIDNVFVTLAAVPTVGSLTGIVTTGAGIDTTGFSTGALRVLITGLAGSLATASASSLVAVLQESNDNGVTDAYASALDNTGVAIGETYTLSTTAVIRSYRIEGLGLNRKRWLRAKLTHNLGGTAVANVFTTSAVFELSRGYSNPVTTAPTSTNT